ncbi:protein PIN-LIKES 7-like [Ananas comosus]|uniref:Protein PIN-LIKES 7-like n=1 Tax=Ananas comosus TaxID=4615 RepID=A0A199W2W1_ANACO|nr:protein PIN-LIKES 7-like [Ananas comosus]XP_020113429.1 protein PIN-LIKES 7-like [Ananas comosus]OAY83822.1 putative transporter [Ananas comosus]
MGFFSLFLVASMPIVQVLLIGLLGAFLASGYSNILTVGARKDMNKVVFAVFTPSLMFANLAKTVTLQDAISWWFMPVNIGIIFLVGGLLGWVAVKILRPPQHLGGLVIASCSAGNLGNLLLIIVPAVCDEDGNPFGGERSICSARGLSYASFSMALGGFYIWTHTYSLMKRAGKLYHRNLLRNNLVQEIEHKDSFANGDSGKAENGEAAVDQEALIPTAEKPDDESQQNQLALPLLSSDSSFMGSKKNFWDKLKEGTHQIVEELLAPPTVSAIIGFIVGATPWLKSLFIGDAAPLRVIQDSVKLLGDGTIPCITLILGGNLTQGLRKSVIRPVEIAAIILVRYLILPVIGVAVVKAAYEIGFLPQDPLYRYVLMIQFTLPPAMNIGTMAQLYDVGQEECSVIFLWTYLVAGVALTAWSTVFMWILS